MQETVIHVYLWSTGARHEPTAVTLHPFFQECDGCKHTFQNADLHSCMRAAACALAWSQRSSIGEGLRGAWWGGRTDQALGVNPASLANVIPHTHAPLAQALRLIGHGCFSSRLIGCFTVPLNGNFHRFVSFSSSEAVKCQMQLPGCCEERNGWLTVDS